MGQTVSKEAYLAMQGEEMAAGSWFHIDQAPMQQATISSFTLIPSALPQPLLGPPSPMGS